MDKFHLPGRRGGVDGRLRAAVHRRGIASGTTRPASCSREAFAQAQTQTKKQTSRVVVVENAGAAGRVLAPSARVVVQPSPFDYRVTVRTFAA